MNNGKFKKGNPGKPKGTLNKNTKLIKDVFVDVFNDMQNDPKVSLLEWAKLHPTDFYKLAIRLIPTQFELNNKRGIFKESPVIFS